ncbi:hypothetical protein RYX36_034068 [Vicia faba]
MRQAGIVNMGEILEKKLASELSKKTLQEAFTLARAFSHYLTMMGIAETHHRVELPLMTFITPSASRRLKLFSQLTLHKLIDARFSTNTLELL